jgi:hypothetical protein
VNSKSALFDVKFILKLRRRNLLRVFFSLLNISHVFYADNAVRRVCLPVFRLRTEVSKVGTLCHDFEESFLVANKEVARFLLQPALPSHRHLVKFLLLSFDFENCGTL